MRLQRLATYRLIRMLRAVLPVIVVILVGIPARNYWISRISAKSPETKVASPAADVVGQTNELSLTRKENGRVVFFGDSITDFWKLDEAFPAKPYVNRGISGQTTPQMLIRFRPDKAPKQCTFEQILPQTLAVNVKFLLR
jgi:hypothetical protein